ncbi:hypothetical protein PV326_002466 [Microctonus aethiopoides]|nr:hypothetical protein PV326_002466 [Microctonus aethiopoides]
MTLHWWMHWFWVTIHVAVIIAIPVPSTTERSQINNDQNILWRTVGMRITTVDANDNFSSTEILPIKSSMRTAKAINSYQLPIKGNSYGLSANPPMFRPITSSRVFNPNIEGRTLERMEEEDDVRAGQFVHRRKDTRITWIWTTTRPLTRQRSNTDGINDKLHNLDKEEEKDLTVLPLRLEERIKVTVNKTRTFTTDDEIDLFSTRTINGSEDIEIDQVAEPRMSSVTSAPILHANLAESTRLSRARNTFKSDFQRDQAEDRSFHIDDNDDVIDNGDDGIDNAIGSINAERPRPSAIDVAAITGSCLAIIILVSSIASLGFIMYRRKYLNPPQTLNSDKCSNPDSSGYIDDSTIRDNSEEMYSLDNDSFLNSLEAMTIQNYWTDSVKHTKL